MGGTGFARERRPKSFAALLSEPLDQVAKLRSGCSFCCLIVVQLYDSRVGCSDGREVGFQWEFAIFFVEE